MEVASHTGERGEEGTGVRGGSTYREETPCGASRRADTERKGERSRAQPRAHAKSLRAEPPPGRAGQGSGGGRAARGPPRVRSGGGAWRPPAGWRCLALAVPRSLPRRAGPPVCGVCRLCVCVLLGMQKKKKGRKKKEKTGCCTHRLLWRKGSEEGALT